MNITRMMGITEAQRASLKVLGAVEDLVRDDRDSAVTQGSW